MVLLGADVEVINKDITDIQEEMTLVQGRINAAQIEQGNVQDDAARDAATATIQKEKDNLKRLVEDVDKKIVDRDNIFEKIEEQKQLPNPNK